MLLSVSSAESSMMPCRSALVCDARGNPSSLVCQRDRIILGLLHMALFPSTINHRWGSGGHMGARRGDQGGEQAEVGGLRLGEGWRFSTGCWPSPSGNHYGCRHPQAPLIPSEAPSPRPHPPRQAEQAGRQPSREEGDGDVPRRRVAGGGKRDGAEGTVEEIKGKIVHGENRGSVQERVKAVH
jgi:hypothetical protein